jgi:hypothetical protein
MNVPAVNDLQQKLSAVMEELDHKVFRPQQVRSRRPPSAPTMAPRAIDRAGSTSLTVPTPRSRPTPLARAQKAAFLCQAKCTDMSGPQEEMHRCLQQCGEPIARHEAAVMGELQQFQQRIQRCVVQCQDRQAGATAPDTKKYEKCVSECAVFYQKELKELRPKLLKKP